MPAAVIQNPILNSLYACAASEREQDYRPDYLVRLDDGRGPADPLNFVVEVTGDNDPDKKATVVPARDLWVPTVNHEGVFDLWAVYDVGDPWSAKFNPRALLSRLQERAA
jgi:type III restriction enzyme